MHRLRLAFVIALTGLAMPVAVFFLGAFLYDGPQSKITNALWAPPLAVQSMFEASCTRPFSGSFVCPYGQGAHNRLFFTSFFLAYFFVGAAVAGLIVGICAQMRHKGTSDIGKRVG